MSEAAIYKGELEFLNTILGNKAKQYRSAPWLYSEYAANTWECKFSDGQSIKIGFEIRFAGGDLLTSARHQKTLDAFKCWLCVQTHIDATGGLVLAPSTAKNKITKTLHIIDYLLLNAQSLQIEEHGLSVLTENDLTGILMGTSKNLG